MATAASSTTARALASTTTRSSARVVTPTSRSSTAAPRTSTTSSARAAAPLTSTSSSAALIRSTTSRPAATSAGLPTAASDAGTQSVSSEQASATPAAGKSSNTGVIAAVIAIVVVLCLVGGLVLWRRRTAASRKEKRNLLARRSDAWAGGVFPDSPSVVSSKSPTIEKDNGGPEHFPWRPDYPFAGSPYTASNMSINSTAPLIQSYPDSPAAPSYREEHHNPYEPTAYIPPYAFPAAAPLQTRPESPAYPPAPSPLVAPAGPTYVPRSVAEEERVVVTPLKMSGRHRQDSLGLPEKEELGDRPTSDISEAAFDSFPKPPTLMRQDSSMARPLSASSQDSSMARPVSFGEARPVSFGEAQPLSYLTVDSPTSPQGFPQTPTTAHRSNSGRSNATPLHSATGDFSIPALPFAESTSGFSPDSTAPNTPAVSRKPSDASIQGRGRSVTPSLPPLEQHKDRGSWNFLGDWDR